MQAAILVGLAMAVLWFLEKLGGTPMVIRPIVVSPVIGALLGDLQTGVMVGATLELVFMGAIQIGAAVPPDVLVGAEGYRVYYSKLVYGSCHETGRGRGHQEDARLKYRRTSASVLYVFRSRLCGSALRFTGG